MTQLHQVTDNQSNESRVKYTTVGHVKYLLLNRGDLTLWLDETLVH